MTVEDLKQIMSKLSFVSPLGQDSELKQAGETGPYVGNIPDNFINLLVQKTPELYVHFNKLLNGKDNPEVLLDCKMFFDDLNILLKEELPNSEFSKLLTKSEDNHGELSTEAVSDSSSGLSHNS